MLILDIAAETKSNLFYKYIAVSLLQLFFLLLLFCRNGGGGGKKLKGRGT